MSDPDHKPSKADMRASGRVATVVLVLLAVFTLGFLWLAT